jgi:hypothetical protein
MSTGKINISRSVNRLLWPHLRDLGFIVEGGDDRKGWREGRFFQRVRDGRSQSLLFGRSKFGGAVGLVIARQREDGSTEYLDIRQRLPADVLQYRSKEELDLVIDRVRQFIDVWLERPFEPASKHRSTP